MTRTPAHPAPAHPATTEAARHRLQQLQQLSGRRTLSGQHNTPRELSAYSEQAEQITGHRPAVWGQDLGFAEPGDMDGIDHRDAVLAEAQRQHRAGSVVTLMWHAVPPTHEEPVTFDDHICTGPLAEEHWQALMTPGTEVRRRWERQVDLVAELLSRLAAEDVPVLWRPYHEMNGDWFWWGGRSGPHGSAALYRMLFERFTLVHGLDHLVWVWNPNAPRGNAAPYVDFYPGHDVVDVLAADVYGDDYRQSHHDQLVELAGGRPIALGEVGRMPTPALLEAQPRWAWFMTWTEFLTRDHTEDEVRALYDSPRVSHQITG